MIILRQKVKKQFPVVSGRTGSWNTAVSSSCPAPPDWSWCGGARECPDCQLTLLPSDWLQDTNKMIPQK